MNKHDIAKHYKAMKEKIVSSSKLEDIQHEDFWKIQPYFLDKSVENTRTAFRVRTKLIKNIPGNFKNLYQNNPDGLKCSHCDETIMTQSHCVICPGMVALCDGLEMDNIGDMVTFFRKLMTERSKKKENQDMGLFYDETDWAAGRDRSLILTLNTDTDTDTVAPSLQFILSLLISDTQQGVSLYVYPPPLKIRLKILIILDT